MYEVFTGSNPYVDTLVVKNIHSSRQIVYLIAF